MSKSKVELQRGVCVAVAIQLVYFCAKRCLYYRCLSNGNTACFRHLTFFKRQPCTALCFLIRIAVAENICYLAIFYRNVIILSAAELNISAVYGEICDSCGFFGSQPGARLGNYSENIGVASKCQLTAIGDLYCIIQDGVIAICNKCNITCNREVVCIISGRHQHCYCCTCNAVCLGKRLSQIFLNKVFCLFRSVLGIAYACSDQ